MIRTQVQLTEKQAELLKRLAAQKDVSMAEVIRQGIDTLFKEDLGPVTEERKKRALGVVGKFRSGGPDISEQHDEYLAEAYKCIRP